MRAFRKKHNTLIKTLLDSNNQKTKKQMSERVTKKAKPERPCRRSKKSSFWEIHSVLQINFLLVNDTKQDTDYTQEQLRWGNLHCCNHVSISPLACFPSFGVLVFVISWRWYNTFGANRLSQNVISFSSTVWLHFVSWPQEKRSFTLLMHFSPLSIVGERGRGGNWKRMGHKNAHWPIWPILSQNGLI